MSQLAYRSNTLIVNQNSAPDAWGANYTVTAYEVGAQVASVSGATVTVRRGHGFQQNDRCIKVRDGSFDLTVYANVDSISATSVVLGANHESSLAAGDILVNLGPDTGVIGTGPNYDGSPVNTYSTMDGTSAVSEARVTADSTGGYEYWSESVEVWELVRDSSGTPVSAIIDAALTVNTHRFVYATAGTSQEDAINAAITQANLEGGGVVELGPGTFTIDAAVTMLSNVWLRGSGMGTTIVKLGASATVIQQTATAAQNFIRISDLTVDGDDGNVTSGNTIGINIRNCNHTIIENVEAKNFRQDGIRVSAFDQNVEKVVVRNCSVHDVMSASTAGGGILIDVQSAKTVQDIIITGNFLEDIGDGNSNVAGDGIAVSGDGTHTRANISDNILRTIRKNGIWVGTNGSRASITGNNVMNAGQANDTNGGNGIFLTSDTGEAVIADNTVDGVAASSDNGIEIAPNTGPSGDVLITGNRVTNVASSTRGGIFCGTCDRAVISSNHCYNNTGWGISAEMGTNNIESCALVGNLCESNGGHGIRYRGKNCVACSGNVCRANTTNGIFLGFLTAADSDQTAIVGNVCDTNGQAGIRVDSASGATNMMTIAGNVCSTNSQRGIVILTANGVAITGNVCDTNGYSGLRADDITDAIISGNMLKGNGTDAGASDDDGITLNGTCTDVYITNNSILDNDSRGIEDAGGTFSRVHIRDNYFNGNTTAEMSTTFNTEASAATLTLPGSSFVDLTGTTAVTSITATYEGHIVTLRFTDSITMTDGGNLVLATNFAATNGDTMMLVCDGTNWHEIARSNNA